MPEGKSEYPDDILETARHYANKTSHAGHQTVEEHMARKFAFADAILAERQRSEPAVKFSKEILRGVFEGCDIDGFEAQELGVKCGILGKVAFDPAKHRDPEGLCEKGDWWFEFAGPLAPPSSTEER